MRPIALVMLVAVCFATAARADWPADPGQNLPISQAPGTQTGHASIDDGASGTIVFWTDNRSATPGVYGQHVDASAGLHWAANGAFIAPGSFSAATPDGSGGAFLTWLDGGQYHVQHVDANGVATWAPSVAAGDGGAGLVGDGTGGVIVVSKTADAGAYTYALHGQRLDGAGAALWDPSGVPLGAGAGSVQNLIVLPDGSGGALIVWRLMAYDGAAWQIRSQHLDAAGNVLGDAGGHLLWSGATSSPDVQLVGAADGGHGAYVLRTEKDAGGTWRLYAQRLDANGAAVWGGPGALLAWSTYANPSELQLCPSVASSVIAAWKMSESAGITLRAQRLDLDGTPQWSAGGVAVCHPTSVSYPCCPGPTGDMFYVHSTTDGLGGALFSYSEYKFKGPPTYDFDVDIKGARVTQAGLKPWSDTGAPICTAVGSQFEPTLVADGGGGAVVTWEDDRTGTLNQDIYAQNLHGDGSIGGAFTSVPPAVPGAWARVWPSPARGRVQLAFSAPGGAAEVVVLDLAGRRVRELVHGMVPASETRMEWDGLDADGRPAAPGVYCIRIVAGTREAMRRVVLVR